LLLEGLCLEVTLDETEHLWSIWQLADPTLKTVVFCDPAQQRELTNGNMKRKLTTANGGEQSAKKKKALAIKEKADKKKDSTTPKVPRKSGKKSKSAEEELCSMGEKCVRPNSAEVNWVACDGPCEGWFHTLCTGMSVDEVASMEHYYCNSCKEATEPSEAKPEIKTDESQPEADNEMFDTSIADTETVVVKSEVIASI